MNSNSRPLQKKQKLAVEGKPLCAGILAWVLGDCHWKPSIHCGRVVIAGIKHFIPSRWVSKVYQSSIDDGIHIVDKNIYDRESRSETPGLDSIIFAWLHCKTFFESVIPSQ